MLHALTSQILAVTSVSSPAVYSLLLVDCIEACNVKERGEGSGRKEVTRFSLEFLTMEYPCV
jgi:hypothetical protein